MKIKKFIWNLKENFRARGDEPRKVSTCFTWNGEEAKRSREDDFRFEKRHLGLGKEVRS